MTRRSSKAVGLALSIAAAVGVTPLATAQAEPARAEAAAPAASRAEVAARVRKIVVDHLGLEPGAVTERSRFVEDLGADSLDLVELVMACEEEFDISISDADAERVVTVGDAIDYLVAKGVA